MQTIMKQPIQGFVSFMRPRRRTIALLGFWLLLIVIAAPQVYAAELPQGGDIAGALADLAKKVIDALVLISGILLAIGFATGFVQGQIAVMAGSPYALAGTWIKVAGIVICFLGVIFAIPIANAIIDAVATMRPGPGIDIGPLR